MQEMAKSSIQLHSAMPTMVIISIDSPTLGTGKTMPGVKATTTVHHLQDGHHLPISLVLFLPLTIFTSSLVQKLRDSIAEFLIILDLIYLHLITSSPLNLSHRVHSKLQLSYIQNPEDTQVNPSLPNSETDDRHACGLHEPPHHNVHHPSPHT
jgi:hypothetical protein